jgi:hypothetical protein
MIKRSVILKGYGDTSIQSSLLGTNKLADGVQRLVHLSIEGGNYPWIELR